MAFKLRILSNNMITVTIAKLPWEHYKSYLPQLWLFLSSKEQQRAHQWIAAKDREKFIIIRGILRALLGKFTKCNPKELVFNYNAWGKPLLIYPITYHFNLSHAKKWAVYAFSKEVPVGIDIEYQNRDLSITKLANRYFSKRENLILARLNTEEN